MNLQTRRTRSLLLFAFIFFLTLAAQAFAVSIDITAPQNTTISDTTPDLNFTTSGNASVTYSWDGGGIISGCRNCNSFSTVYGENDGSDANLVALWHFNGNEYPTMYDETSNDNDGTLGNLSIGGTQPKQVQKGFAYALDFDGDNDFVDVNDSQSLDFTKNLTMAAWVRPELETWPQNAFVVGKENAYAFRFVGGNLSLMLHNGITWKAHNSGTVVPLNNWSYVAATYSGSMVKLYINGAEVHSALEADSIAVNEHDLRIGSYANSTGWESYFKGIIDDVAIYDRSLSGAEIQALYNKSLSVDPDSPHNVTVYANDSNGTLNSMTRYFTVTPPVHNNNSDKYFLTIQEAINDSNTAEGHTITVAAGEYNESVNITMPLNIVGAGAVNTFVRSPDGNDSVFYIGANAIGVNISGLRIAWAENSSGIYIDGASNVNISNNILRKNRLGIYLRGSNNSIISNNNASLNNEDGIYVNSSSYNNITNNIADSNGLGGISLWNSSSYNNIINNTANSNIGYDGIYINSSSYNNIINNIANSNNNTGIVLVISDNNIITNNTASLNGWGGINLNSSSYNNITNNTATFNTWDGIYLRNSKNSTISGNNASNNLYLNGIALGENSDNTLVENNILNSNKNNGMWSWNSSNLTIINNTAKYNGGSGYQNSGIHLNLSNNNDIINNTFYGNYWDFNSINSFSNTITSNLFNNTMASFTYFGDISVNSSLSPAGGTPIAWTGIGKYLNVANTSAAWVFLNISYADVEWGETINDTLGMYRHNGTAWENVSESWMNNVIMYIYTNATEFGVFAPLGKDNTTPRIKYNPDTIESGNYSQNWIFVNVSVDDSNLDTVALEINSKNYTNPQTDGTNYWWNGTLVQDIYTLKVYANDSAWNTNATGSRTIILDTTPPDISIVSPANATTNDSTPLLNATFVETVNYVWYSVDGENTSIPVGSTKNLTKNLSTLSDGLHNATVYANDSANNLGSATRWFTVDTTPPNVTIDSPTNTTYNTSAIWINVTAWDNIEGFASTLNVTAELDGKENRSLSNLSGNWNYRWTNVSDGPHNITIYANDSVGNMNDTEVIYFTIDTALPYVTINAPTNITIADTTPDLDFTINETANVTYSWDGEGNISGCRECNSSNTTYGEYANSSEQNLSVIWHFNEDTGDSAFDDSGSNDALLGNGTAGQKPNWTAGRFGRGLKFDGTNDYASIPYDSTLDVLNGDKPFTLGMWFKLDKLPSDASMNAALFSQADGGGAGKAWFTMASIGGGSYAADEPYSYIGGTVVGSNVVVTVDTWYFVVVTYNGTHSTIYINGTAGDTVNVTADQGANGEYHIGANKGATNAWFNGTIDEVMLFDRNLSAAEIADIYNKSLADGQHNVTVYATDTAENVNSTTKWFTVDTTPPTITVNFPKNITYGIGYVDYKITVNEPLNWANVSINGTANMTLGNSSLQYFNLSGDHLPLPEGTHNATFYVQDLMGYTNQTTVYFTVNYSAPDINITSPENTTYGNGSLDYNMTITNNVNLTGATVEVNGPNYTMDNSSLYDWYNTAVGELSEGLYNATFYAYSTFFDSTDTVYFTVDTSPPYDVTLNYPQNNSNISSPNITFNWTSYDNISIQLWSNLTINGSVNESGVDTSNGTLTDYTVSELADGTYSWSVMTWDQADNNAGSAVYYFMVDTAPPNVSFITPSANDNLSGTVYVNVTVTDANDANTGVYEVYVQNGTDGEWINMNPSEGNISEGNWSYLWNTSTSPDGTVTLRINATDFAGGSNTAVTRNVTVDNTPPNITIILPGNTTYGNTSIDLNVSADETIDTWWYEYNNNGTNIIFTQNTTLYAGGGTGPKNIAVYANDSAGNLGSSIRYFTVDITLPAIIIDSPLNKTIPDNTPDLNSTINEKVNVTYSWDGEGNISGCRSCNSYSTTYGESVPEANTSLLFNFNGKFENTTYDDSGQNNHGTIIGADWTQGKFSSALYFDGSASVEVPDNNDTLDFSVNDSFTVGVWIKTDIDIGFILNKRENIPTSPGWELFLQGGMVYFKMKNSNGASFELDGMAIGGLKLNDSSWHHTAVTYNGTSKNGSLYVDGNVVNSAINPLTGYTNNSLSLHIGRRQGSAVEFFNGTIDDLHILRRTLNATEIAAEYNKSLDEGSHYVTVHANDTAGNFNSTTRYFIVDTIAPTWDQTPENQTVEANMTFTYDVNASDNAIDTYFINDTNFAINPTSGVITNNTVLELGTHGLNISVNDTSNNVNYTVITVTVQDTTTPTWIQTLSDQPAEANMTFTYEVNASDNAIDTYFINDTNFAINAISGVINNNTVLNFGNHSLNISVNDTSGNVLSAVITITVQDTIPPTITLMPPSPADDDTLPSGEETVAINMSIVESNPDTLIINWNSNNASYGSYTSSYRSITGPPGWSFSDGNTYTYYVWVNDTSGNSAQTETRTFSVRSSTDGTSPGPNGGPSPISTSAPQVTVKKGVAVITFSSIDIGSPATFTVPDTEDVYLTRLLLAVKKKVTNVRLTVSTLGTRPAAVGNDVVGIVYKYLDIVHENVDNGDISIVILTFKVEKSWIDDNDIDPDSITLNRYSRGTWTPLTTTRLSCDSDYCYHEVGSPGLSVFSISGSVVTAGPATQNPTTRSSPTSAPTITDLIPASSMTPAPIDKPLGKLLFFKEGKPFTKTVIVVVIFLVILVGAYMYYRHRRREGKWWDDRIKSTEDEANWAVLEEGQRE